MLKRNYLLGLVAGVAIVLISGILITLDKGSEAGKIIKRKLRYATTNLKERFSRYTAGVTRIRENELSKPSSPHT